MKATFIRGGAWKGRGFFSIVKEELAKVLTGCVVIGGQ